MIALRMRRIDTAMFNRLQRVGESFVNNARSIDTYKDQTGNLRSSIGYLIYFNGKERESNFERSNKGRGLKAGLQRTKGDDSNDPVDAAIKFAQKIAEDHPRGYCLVVVAGRSYAANVEARGYDVLTNSGLIAANDLKTSLEQLIKKII